MASHPSFRRLHAAAAQQGLLCTYATHQTAEREQETLEVRSPRHPDQYLHVWAHRLLLPGQKPSKWTLTWTGRVGPVLYEPARRVTEHHVLALLAELGN